MLWRYAAISTSNILQILLRDQVLLPSSLLDDILGFQLDDVRSIVRDELLLRRVVRVAGDVCGIFNDVSACHREGFVVPAEATLVEDT